MFLGIAILILGIAARWIIFDKAGVEGWKSIIPLYNTYIFYKITWGNGWYSLLLLVPVVNAVIGIVTFIKLAKAFDKGIGFAIGLIFLNVIFLPILAFGEAEYVGVY